MISNKEELKDKKKSSKKLKTDKQKQYRIHLEPIKDNHTNNSNEKKIEKSRKNQASTNEVSNENIQDLLGRDSNNDHEMKEIHMAEKLNSSLELRNKQSCSTPEQPKRKE